MNWGILLIALSLLFVAVAILFGRYNHNSTAVLMTCLALSFCILGAMELHIQKTFTMVEVESTGSSVTRFYDYNGNVIEEIHGDMRMIHEPRGIIVEQNDSVERIFINEDGEVEVVKE